MVHFGQKGVVDMGVFRNLDGEMGFLRCGTGVMKVKQGVAFGKRRQRKQADAEVNVPLRQPECAQMGTGRVGLF